MWSELPRFYGGWRPNKVWGSGAGYTVVRVDPGLREFEIQRMAWLNGANHDVDYQGMLTPFGLPNGSRVVVPVQRDSRPVIFDWNSREVVGHIDLCERRGNPTLHRRSADEIWVDDYDTMIVLRAADLTKLRHARLQDANDGFTQMWFGGWCFNADRSVCVVAQPFSGDVIALQCDSLAVTHRAQLGHQPVRVALLSDGRVFAREWKTGKPHVGVLEPISEGPV